MDTVDRARLELPCPECAETVIPHSSSSVRAEYHCPSCSCCFSARLRDGRPRVVSRQGTITPVVQAEPWPRRCR